MEQARDRIIVVGAGFAGVSAVHHLLCAGVPGERVLLLERAPHVGGRAFSFVDRESGHVLDNGQHVLLGCCTAFTRLLHELTRHPGVCFQPLLSIPVYANGRFCSIESRRLPGPLHLVPSLLRYAHVSLDGRLRIAQAAFAMLAARPDHLDAHSFRAFLERHGQTDDVIRLVWDLVGTAILNGHAGDISAGLAVESFQIGFLRGPEPSRLGLFTRPLGDLAAEAVASLQARGVELRRGRAVRVVADETGVTSVRLADGSSLSARCVILAVPHDQARSVLPDGAIDRTAWLARVRYSPILNVYLEYPHAVMEADVAASYAMGGMFVFNRGRLLGNAELDGRLLSISISAADAYRSWAADEIAREVEAAVAEMFPAAREVGARWGKVVWQPKATFLAEPELGLRRPGVRSRLRGLYLAGDWVDTGWPACLEGAVRSGEMAAAAAREDGLA
ncbi:hydroxysqualene dehydroxylase HpnE [Alicyclobacillus acidocaldarius]|uniref:Squalene-associated FAD-dependent desaturase n=1 Tax=Alicyclobacillus acidocaldarius (strain Tc-4-1) TaxID=1048834 RepID=F8IIU9_ALIAT|nr:hydroxysqualene dehydroxylase HpnE [Alicyclobacillus acidocaldarius]AEJ44624.1 squalene-associated FAD-dependent desaturase [Alicyclobacillus acidocaldarius subsp. acidocaldarius Tc-4-1]